MRIRSLLSCIATAIAGIASPIAVQAQIAVLSSTVEETTVSAGQRYTGSIVIANTSAQAQSVKLYRTDYTFAADGTSKFDDAGTTARSNATWISLQAERVTVPANSEVTVPYSVTVPTDSLHGTYWSTIMVEGTASDANGTSTAGKPAVAIGAILRYAVQVATHIQTSGSRAVRFDSPSLSRSTAGSALLDINVHDDGERGYRPTVWIEVYDADGALRGKARQVRGLLYPGTSVHQRFDLGALPAGTYKAIVFADTGDDAVFATQYTITY